MANHISTLMYTVWHVDKYKITFKVVINEILQHIVVSSGLSRPDIIDGPVPGRGPMVEKH